jgi:hypothetical protein
VLLPPSIPDHLCRKDDQQGAFGQVLCPGVLARAAAAVIKVALLPADGVRLRRPLPEKETSPLTPGFTSEQMFDNMV